MPTPPPRPQPATRAARPASALGFTMVELLVTMAILAIGLLGLASLQVATKSSGTTARERGTATIIAHNMLDKIQSEGAQTAAERIIAANGIVTTTGWVYIDPVGATPQASTAGDSYTILGLLPTDNYYTLNPTADKSVVFTTTWVRNQGTINSYAKTGIQEFIVNVNWNESTTTGLVAKSISVSRYVRL